jgi:hypothetical protein
MEHEDEDEDEDMMKITHPPGKTKAEWHQYWIKCIFSKQIKGRGEAILSSNEMPTWEDMKNASKQESELNLFINSVREVVEAVHQALHLPNEKKKAKNKKIESKIQYAVNRMHLRTAWDVLGTISHSFTDTVTVSRHCHCFSFMLIYVNCLCMCIARCRGGSMAPIWSNHTKKYYENLTESGLDTLKAPNITGSTSEEGVLARKDFEKNDILGLYVGHIVRFGKTELSDLKKAGLATHIIQVRNLAHLAFSPSQPTHILSRSIFNSLLMASTSTLSIILVILDKMRPPKWECWLWSIQCSKIIYQE